MATQTRTVTAWRPAAHPNGRQPDQAPERPPARRSRHWLAGRRAGLAAALISLALGILWAAAVKPLNAPDEPAYLQTVMQVRNGAILPEIHFDFSKVPGGELIGTPGDPAARAYIMSAGYTDPLRIMAYQTVQPPLYFLVTGLVTQLVPPNPLQVLYLSRLVSVVFGAGLVYFCWAATRELAPRAPMWAGAVAGTVALLPESCFNNARVGNDSLVNCLGAAAFYVWFRGLRDPEYDPRMLRAGAVVGLALLAKLTSVVLLPALGLVVLFRMFQPPAAGRAWGARIRRGLRLAAGAGGAMLVICGWWFVRNLIAYGEPSGTATMDRFWKYNLPALNWDNLTARWDWIQSTWRSFWGYFGWMNVALPSEFYDQLLPVSLTLLGLSIIAGLGLIGRQVLRRRAIPAYIWQAVLIMGVVVVVLSIGFVQFNLGVASQPQGRYLFLLLLPAALVFTGGLYALPPGRVLKSIAVSLPLLWLALMNAVGLAVVP